MEGEREGEKHQCVVASGSPHPGDLACSPGTCPGGESNPWPFGSQAHAQSTELHGPGPIFFLISDSKKSFSLACCHREPQTPVNDIDVKALESGGWALHVKEKTYRTPLMSVIPAGEAVTNTPPHSSPRQTPLSLPGHQVCTGIFTSQTSPIKKDTSPQWAKNVVWTMFTAQQCLVLKEKSGRLCQNVLW